MSLVLQQPLRIGVVRGGSEGHHGQSLASGAHLLRSIPDHHIVHDLYIDPAGIWHHKGLPKGPERIIPTIDVFFNALHGTASNDFAAIKLLEPHSQFVTGSPLSALVSSHVFDPTKEREVRMRFRRKMDFNFRPSREIAQEVFWTHSFPFYVVQGSFSRLVRNYHELMGVLERLERRAFALDEYVAGKQYVCLVIQDFRAEDRYVTMPLEVTQGAGGEPVYSIPFIGREEKEILESAARSIYAELGLRHYALLYFVHSPTKGIYYSHAEPFPRLDEDSFVAHALEAVGADMRIFSDHILACALGERIS